MHAVIVASLSCFDGGAVSGVDFDPFTFTEPADGTR